MLAVISAAGGWTEVSEGLKTSEKVFGPKVAKL